MANLAIGDRIRIPRNPAERFSNAIHGIVHRAYGALGPRNVSVNWDSGAESSIHEDNIEVAHYAPVGVPMVAMTSERIRAIRRMRADAMSAAEGEDDAELDALSATIDDMLAEASDESCGRRAWQ